MGHLPDYREVEGLGESLLTLPVGASEVRFHRKERPGLWQPVGREPLGTLVYWVVPPGHGFGSGGLVGNPWSGTVVEDQRVIFGEAPARAVAVEARGGAGPVAVAHAAGVWAVVAAWQAPLAVTFRTDRGKAIKTLRIPAASNTLELLRRFQSRAWPAVGAEDPDYEPTPPEEREREAATDGPWAEMAKRYGLGEALVRVPVGDRTAALYRQRQIGRIWCAITGVGGTLRPVEAEYGWQSSSGGGWRVITGLLPPDAVTAEATARRGGRLPVHMLDNAFLVVTGPEEPITLRLRNARGRAVWTHRIRADGDWRPPDFVETLRIYWLAYRIWWRSRRTEH
jgi:hypothetical protein